MCYGNVGAFFVAEFHEKWMFFCSFIYFVVVFGGHSVIDRTEIARKPNQNRKQNALKTSN